MTTCPPAPQTQYDMRNANTCVDMCGELLKAYYTVITGNQRITVRFNERWSEYYKANADQLREQYMVLWNQCPAARASGLPDLNPAKAVRRGAPMRGFNSFPRL